MIIFEPTLGLADKTKPRDAESEAEPVQQGMQVPASIKALPEGSSEVTFLLRQYQDGIAVWMDLFDHDSNYQRLLMRRAATSKLLRDCVCSLAARQLALITNALHWKRAAAKYYGESLRLLLADMGRREPNVALTLPASILLLSYELLSFPGQDYNRHFFGAKSLIESAGLEHVKKDRLALASYWIFVRHDMIIALARESPTLLDPRFLIEIAPSDDVEEDVCGNAFLLLAARVLRLIHGNLQDLEYRDTWSSLVGDLALWERKMETLNQCLQLEHQASNHCYTIPAAAAARQTYLVARLLLFLDTPNDGDRRVDAHTDDAVHETAEEIAAISFEHVSDAMQVQAVPALRVAAKHCTSATRDRVVALLTELQARTGFHTKRTVDAIIGLTT